MGKKKKHKKDKQKVVQTPQTQESVRQVPTSENKDKITKLELTQSNVAIQQAVNNLENLVSILPQEFPYFKQVELHSRNLRKLLGLILDMSKKRSGQEIGFCCTQIEAAETAMQKALQSTKNPIVIPFLKQIVSDLKTVLSINKKFAENSQRESLSTATKNKLREAEANGFNSLEDMCRFFVNLSDEFPDSVEKNYLQIVKSCPGFIEEAAKTLESQTSTSEIFRTTVPSLEELCVNKILEYKDSYYFPLWSLNEEIVKQYPMLEVDYRRDFKKEINRILTKYQTLKNDEKYSSLYGEIQKALNSTTSVYNQINSTLRSFQTNKTPMAGLKKGFFTQDACKFIPDLKSALTEYDFKRNEYEKQLSDKVSNN